MAVSMSPKQKVYQAVLNEIRRYIDENNLVPGDKLPSERYLAESLKAGRSSIREALRAMELLGLIETRSGQGTYLSTYNPYQTVELLASFILQGSKVKQDLTTAKTVIEKEVAKLAFFHINPNDIQVLEKLVKENNEKQHAEFFRILFLKTDNLLLTRIWGLMEEFSETIQEADYGKMFYEELINHYKNQNYAEIETLFKRLTDEQ